MFDMHSGEGLIPVFAIRFRQGLCVEAAESLGSREVIQSNSDTRSGPVSRRRVSIFATVVGRLDVLLSSHGEESNGQLRRE